MCNSYFFHKLVIDYGFRLDLLTISSVIGEKAEDSIISQTPVSIASLIQLFFFVAMGNVYRN